MPIVLPMRMMLRECHTAAVLAVAVLVSGCCVAPSPSPTSSEPPSPEAASVRTEVVVTTNEQFGVIIKMPPGEKLKGEIRWKRGSH